MSAALSPAFARASAFVVKTTKPRRSPAEIDKKEGVTVMKYRRKKKRSSPELHWGYNYSNSRIPVVSGSGRVEQGIFDQDEQSAHRIPKVHIAVALAFVGAVLISLGFWLLLTPFGWPILLGIVVLVLRGFSQTPDWEKLSISRQIIR